MKKNYAILAMGLVAYGLKRYNGYDLNSYFQLAEYAYSGVPLYGENHLSLYPPAGAYLLELLHYLPNNWTHWVWYVLSILVFYRISQITFWFFAPPKVSTWKTIIFFWLSWIAILQGLGAQLEGGNINLLLMYSMFEGLNFLLRGPNRATDLFFGLLLSWLPVVFKPYLGLVSSGLTIFFMKRLGWRAVLAPLTALFLTILVPALMKGIQTVRSDYEGWLSGDISYIDCAFTLKCNAVNYGLPSYLYHIHHWSLGLVSLVIVGVSVAALVYAFFEKNLVRLSATLSLITFCISPATFPYTLMLLWITVVASSYVILFNGDSNNRRMQIVAGIFLSAMIFLNPTYLSRNFFNEVIVHYRVITFFILLGLGPLTAAIKMAERERFELSIGY